MSANRSVRSIGEAAVSLLVLATVTTCLAACNDLKPARGQVVAVVNRVEITTAEVQLEARLRGVPIGRDASLRAALTGELVDRELLAQAAERAGLQKSPEFILTMRRLGKLALAQQLIEQAEGRRGDVDVLAARLLASEPQRFAERVVMRVDRLTLGQPPSAALRQALNAAGTVDNMLKLLQASGTRASRSTEDWDSLTLPSALASKLRPLRAGDDFVSEDGLLAGQVILIVRQPITPQQRLELARELIRRDQEQRATAVIVADAKRRASITYQPGYRPDR